MQGSYESEVIRFFRETEDEIDPDAAIFIRFFRDPAFWLWFGDEIKRLCSQAELQDSSARPKLDRYLHGLICADTHEGQNGSVIHAMTEVLHHSPEVFSGLLCLPALELEKSLEVDAGPHSRFASSRFINHLWAILGSGASSILESITGPIGDELRPMVVSASIGLPSFPEDAQKLSVIELRSGLLLKLLTNVQSTSLPGSQPITAYQVFDDAALNGLSREGYLDWPEWQLLPLIPGGIEFARDHGIDLIEVSRVHPIGGKEVSIWSAAFMVGHAASSDALHDFFCNELLPSGDPTEIMKNIWSMGTAMSKWAPGYIAKHREVFLATPAPSEAKLEQLIRYGVDKRTVLSHPDFSQQAKGRVLSDDLGM